MKNNTAIGTEGNGSEFSGSPVTPKNGDSTSTEPLPLSEQLQNHLLKCSECQQVLQAKTPRGFGMGSRLCSEYKQIIRDWADNEGMVNNIVDHDEYGNQASKTIHERYPEQWR